ncbi:PRD domain-containing protein [uncultured Parolsenella sp.]|uniref:PRD domain-containing protein n=1 Tax=uncultured Parolsenella sp. TaxID=2083008 RepID=UPI0027DB646F|nr:PRD domain-containing protein [uncultured Parolsenella sp.]
MNDNVAIAVDESGEEAIVTGRGLVYANKVGSLLHERLVRRVYSARGDGANRRLQALFSEIPYACIEVAEQIVDVASAATDQKLGQNLVVSPSDHINFAVERARNGTYRSNLLSDEIESFYPAECFVGQQALGIIERKPGVTLDLSEAASIAFHVIDNSERGGAGIDAIQIIQGVEGMMEVIQRELGIAVSKDRSHYARLVVHLKSLMRRMRHLM